VIFPGGFEKGLQFLSKYDGCLKVQVFSMKLLWNAKIFRFPLLSEALDTEFPRLEVGLTGHHEFRMIIRIKASPLKAVNAPTSGAEVVTIKDGEDRVHGVFVGELS
jgi:hypothetical protein